MRRKGRSKSPLTGFQVALIEARGALALALERGDDEESDRLVARVLRLIEAGEAEAAVRPIVVRPWERAGDGREAA